MELYLFTISLFIKPQGQCRGQRADKTKNSLRSHGACGEIVLSLILSVSLGMMLFLGLFILNKHYERKTKDHLHDFQNHWNRLEKKFRQT